MCVINILLKKYSVFDICVQKFSLLSGFKLKLDFFLGCIFYSKFRWDRILCFQKNLKV